MRACDYSAYEIKYRTTYSERVSTYGGMDSEPTGNKITEERLYFVVAPNEGFARCAFNRYHANDEHISTRCLFVLNDLVHLQ